MPADHLMSFADAKLPERRFYGKIIPHGAVCKGLQGTVRCIHSAYTLPLDGNKSDLTLFCVLVRTHAATCPTGIWTTSVWHKMPSAEAGVAEPKKCWHGGSPPVPSGM